MPFIWISRPDQQATGASMRISEVTRIPPQSVDPSVKNYHWLDLDLALLDAYDHDADLVVLRDLSGAITEGPGYNVFAHVDGRWLTPGSGTLAGITRRSVIELAREAGQPVDEGRLTADDLRRVRRGAGHLHRRRDHAGDGHRRQARRHGRARAADACSCGTGTGPATRTRGTPPRSATRNRLDVRNLPGAPPLASLSGLGAG